MLYICNFLFIFLSFTFSGEPKLEFKEYEKTFGSIKEGRIVNVTYEFENKGEKPLLIKDVQSSCGCTAVSFPQYPVKSGTKDFITVKFISLGKEGFQDKEIRVVSNDPRGIIKLKLTGKVLGR